MKSKILPSLRAIFSYVPVKAFYRAQLMVTAYALSAASQDGEALHGQIGKASLGNRLVAIGEI